jgi:hypothetical protein
LAGIALNDVASIRDKRTPILASSASLAIISTLETYRHDFASLQITNHEGPLVAVSSYSQFQELMFRYSAESGYRISVDFNDSYSS